MMQLSLPADQLSSYIRRLLQNHFPDGVAQDGWSERAFSHALARCEHCFSHIRRKYYFENGSTAFNHLNADHMASFLYLLGNSVWRESGDGPLATKLSYLNKVMHGLDLFYSVKLPEVFLLVHPVGTVLGNASYGDYLVVYQNCTVGAVGRDYPEFGIGTILYSRSSVLGKCRIGNDVVLAANSAVVSTDISANSVVLGLHPANRILANAEPVRVRCFD